MSILSLGRRNPGPVNPAPVGAYRRWWDWSPARREPVEAPASTATVVPERDPWYSWNADRRTTKQVEVEGRSEGYAKGVRDEQRVMARRQHRRSHPVVALVVFIAAVSGVGFAGLAWETGSFAAGGAGVDQTLAQWRGDLTGAAGRAVDKSGRAVQGIGQSISSQSQKLTQKGG